MRFGLFGALLVATCAYAALRGGAPERYVAYLYLIAAAATPIAAIGIPVSYATFEGGVFIVDATLLVALLVVAMTANRFWPLAAAALQFDTVGVHLLKLAELEMLPLVYALMTVLWSYLALLVLAAGTYRHRARLQSRQFDPPWARRRRKHRSS